MSEKTPEQEALRKNIAAAIKRGSYRYLEGILQVERKIGKDPKRVEWLVKKIKELKGLDK